MQSQQAFSSRQDHFAKGLTRLYIQFKGTLLSRLADVDQVAQRKLVITPSEGAKPRQLTKHILSLEFQVSPRQKVVETMNLSDLFFLCTGLIASR